MENNIDRSTEVARQEINGALSLSLVDGPQPFALVGDEMKFGSDDWAWMFLSMNAEYRAAYEKQSHSLDPLLAGDIDPNAICGIRADHDGSCALRFGLAAWLSPSSARLPKLSNENDSWFFPLKRPICEDYRRKEVSDANYIRRGPPYSRQLDRFPHLVANESTFGYRRPINIRSVPRTIDGTFNIIWVAIDCSVPPNGQVAGLRALALTNRRALMQNGWVTHDTSNGCSVLEVEKSEVFEHLRFKKAVGATNKVKDAGVLWRAVQLDVLAPITTQVDILLEMLSHVNQVLIAQGLAESPPFNRLKNVLPVVKDSDGESRHGGNYLKALHIIAELTEWGHDANKIAELTGVASETGRHLNRWRRQFHENLEKYTDQANLMVAGGYRSLVQAQKLEASEIQFNHP